MYSTKKHWFISLVLVGILTGCGSSSSSDTEGTNETGEQTSHSEGTEGGQSGNNTTGQTSATISFTSNVMPILKNKCQRCHGSNGRFTITDTQGTYNNIKALKGAMPDSALYLVDKGSGTVSHGGGAVIPAGSSEFTTLSDWANAGAPNN